MDDAKRNSSMRDTAVVVLVAVVLGSGVWRLMHDDTAVIARSALTALRNDSRAATFRTQDLPEYWRAWPGIDVANAQE